MISPNTNRPALLARTSTAPHAGRERRDRGRIGDVELEQGERGRVRDAGRGSRCADDVGPKGGEGLADRAAVAARRAGDDRELAVQVDLRRERVEREVDRGDLEVLEGGGRLGGACAEEDRRRERPGDRCPDQPPSRDTGGLLLMARFVAHRAAPWLDATVRANV
jgi:hypothetical protein